MATKNLPAGANGGRAREDGNLYAPNSTRGDHPISVISISQVGPGCQVAPYQLKSINMSEVLALADHALAQANRHKALWLATGDLSAWRLWQAAEADRVALLEKLEVGI